MVEGSFVSDQNSIVAVFEEIASSASLMSAAKVIDLNVCPQGRTIQHSGAQQACTQSELNGMRVVFACLATSGQRSGIRSIGTRS